MQEARQIAAAAQANRAIWDFIVFWKIGFPNLFDASVGLDIQSGLGSGVERL